MKVEFAPQFEQFGMVIVHMRIHELCLWRSTFSSLNSIVFLQMIIRSASTIDILRSSFLTTDDDQYGFYSVQAKNIAVVTLLTKIAP